MKIYISLIFCLALITIKKLYGQFVNFDQEGRQVVRLDDQGNAIDAHDGKIAYFSGKYYLYGTSYDCGFQWGNKSSPFCGFKVYSSKDLKSWHDEGFLFDARSEIWQCRCDGGTYGCFRPHVVFNQKTKKYVLWVNVYDNVIGYRVFTATKPTGPFKEEKEPQLSINNQMPKAGLNNGDHDIFIDSDGTAYLAFTDWRAKGAIVIERLSADYLTGTGQYTRFVTDQNTEAPALFKRNQYYYIAYSDPNCGYCGGTGTSYKRAEHPLGPWSEAHKISQNSCGGQPSFVSVIQTEKEHFFIYGSDLWNNGAKNEALANFFWTPLKFDKKGNILPISCNNFAVNADTASNLQPSTGIYSLQTNITDSNWICQPISISDLSGIRGLTIPLFQYNQPTEDLIIEIYKADINKWPVGPPLYTQKIAPAKLGFSARAFNIAFNIHAISKSGFTVIFRTAEKKGSYGTLFNYYPPLDNTGIYLSKDEGKTFMLQKQTRAKIEYIKRKDDAAK